MATRTAALVLTVLVATSRGLSAQPHPGTAYPPALSPSTALPAAAIEITGTHDRFLSPHALQIMAAEGEGDATPGPRHSRLRKVRTIGFAIGGATIGAWGGYLLSQALKSDWEKSSNGEFRGHRTRYAVGGAAVGSIGGLVIGSGGRAPALQPLSRDGHRHLITREEIERFGAGTTYELIQARRPIWLRKRTTTPSGELLPLQVYVDQARMGGPESLRQVSAVNVYSVEFFDGTAATLRFGWDHPQGAIFVSTAEGSGAPAIH